MGGGEGYWDVPQEQAAQTIEHFEEIQVIEQEIGLGQQIVNRIGERIGWWPMIGLIVIGALVVFRKRIKKTIKAFLA